MISIYEDFVKDYNNPNITGEDVKRLNGLNARQYSHLRAEALSNKTVLVGRFSDEETAQKIVALCKAVNWDLNKINKVIDENKIKPKNYTYVNGYYIVEKRINGEQVVFHRFKDEADAIHMVKELRKMDWDKSKVDLILDEMSLN